MTDLRTLIQLSKQLSPLAAQLVRKVLLGAPNIPLQTRIALDPSLRERSQGIPEVTPAEMMALLEPTKHRIPQDRLLAHLQALHFVQACTQEPETRQNDGDSGGEPDAAESS